MNTKKKFCSVCVGIPQRRVNFAHERDDDLSTI